MFSSKLSDWKSDFVNYGFASALHRPFKLGTETNCLSDCLMNPPLKRGKYSMVVDDDDDGKVGTSSEQPQEGWKQCDYVSNKMRLRCQNVRKHESLKNYGFCEEHRGFIERIKQEGLRAKHCFDPSFNVSQIALNLINDVDETLLPKHPADFPFVIESSYCDNQIDNNDNPLSRAKIFTKREIVKQYISALRRQDASIQQMRLIYQEKHRRTLHQIMELKGKAQLTKLDQTKDSQKIKRILAMRQYLLRRHNWDRILVRKFTDQTAMAAASSRHQAWMKQLVSPLDDDQKDVKMVVAEMVNFVDDCANSSRAFTAEEMRIVRRKNFMNSDQHGSFCPPLPNAIVDILKQLRTHSKEEPKKGLTQLRMHSKEEPKKDTFVNTNNHNNNNISYGTFHQNLSLQRLIPVTSDKLHWVKQLASPVEDSSQVCARINRPWDGTHPQSKKTKKPRRVNSDGAHHHADNKNVVNTNSKNVANANNNSSISYGTYQQYLSLQRLIPGSRYSLAKTISRT